MTDDLIAAAMRVAGYADAVMRRRMAGLDEPHHDWQPRSKVRRTNIEKWHPPYGESHVKYHVWQAGGGNNPVVWTATHHGLATGPTTYKSRFDDRDHTRTVYEHEDDPERIGRFRTPEDARAAAEAHYRDNYGQPPKHDYDIDSIMNEHDAPPARRGLGDDEDYGHIFGFLRRAGWDYADVIRLAGDGMSWEDTMAHIDRVLAEGDQTPVRKMRTAPNGFRPRPHSPDDGEFDDLADAAEAQRIHDWDRQNDPDEHPSYHYEDCPTCSSTH